MSSPTSIISYDRTAASFSTSSRTKNDKSSPITLHQLIQQLPPLLHSQNSKLQQLPIQERNHFDATIRGTDADPVNQLFGRVDLTKEEEEWRKYAFFDEKKNYTRNLIATDEETFTLLLLCWNAGRESPIHDHPCDGCWVRLCQGRVREIRYECNDETDTMEVTSDMILEDDAPTFISDIQGYHKVGNPDPTLPAVTLHLYCPPFRRCKIWMKDCNDELTASNACMCYYSEYGVKRAC
mmetsp:Transcript_3796/g.5829  ORF Transcript_3796/g.5829 Transcript_3796/m.5829 type:complete len:238 (+) Transcript_3796:124-837(+)|eukprot:CAMPEP_0201729884 /NCGR_PEP_ID=MMETSP0593-20130828/20390_1 /ASSEMBLY_ACC=CAM_ASM_000672 /TAXON_ID=267983 /ORGANISM="Skeletonema japonicum, Strain CCMP2506" /LENGTH=237 /DNA_ID=CAMNT_0048222309 /DNA_START=121 /DNA_END=834 /DNA_ORIENTATION=+